MGYFRLYDYIYHILYCGITMKTISRICLTLLLWCVLRLLHSKKMCCWTVSFHFQILELHVLLHVLGVPKCFPVFPLSLYFHAGRSSLQTLPCRAIDTHLESISSQSPTSAIHFVSLVDVSFFAHSLLTPRNTAWLL